MASVNPFTTIQRHTRPKRVRSEVRRGPLRSPAFLAHVRTFMCLTCYATRGIAACHTENNGMSSKGPDSGCVPLCSRCHAEYDANKKKFEREHLHGMLSLKDQAQASWRIWVKKEATRSQLAAIRKHWVDPVVEERWKRDFA